MTIKRSGSFCLLCALFWGAAATNAAAAAENAAKTGGEQPALSAHAEEKKEAEAVAPPENSTTARTGEQTVIPSGAGATQGRSAPPAEGQTVEQPFPIAASGNPAGSGLDPFIATPKKIFTPDYGKGMNTCRLRGVCKIGGKQIGIFSVSDKAGGAAATGAGEQLLMVTTGEQIKFFAENVEYILTVRELGSRTAVLVGENEQIYKVYL